MNAQGKQQVRTGAGMVPLGPELGSGGEGAVYEIVGRGDTVAKIYHKPVDREKAEKLATMAAIRDDRLRAVTAWPTEALMTPGGSTCGFLMPRLSGYKDIHLLYGPRSRRKEFPTAQFRFLVRAAANTARAFAVVHAAGCVIGDVNHGGIAISSQATAKLLDCDSFQVSASGRTFSSDVGTPLYTPPEMQGRSFRGAVRQPNHDGFGLAVILFHLLFAGRHPFAGRYLGDGDMHIEQAIKEFRFAYGQSRTTLQMEPPPGAPPLETASQPVALLFERAFSREGVNGSRPTANEWASALSSLENQTRQCSLNASHHYPAALPSCPWCTVEATTRVVLFRDVVQRAPDGGSVFDIHTAWTAIAAVSAPGAAPNPPDRSGIGVIQPSPEAVSAAGSAEARTFLTIAVVVVLIVLTVLAPAGFILWLFLGGGIAAAIRDKKPNASVLQRFKSSLDSANAQLRSLESRWRSEASDDRFVARLRQLEAAKQTWQDLHTEQQRLHNERQGPHYERLLHYERQQRLQTLENQREYSQRQAFLERFQLVNATIPGIGLSRRAMLTSYGVETAADIDASRIRQIPGFGPAMIRRLLQWRKELEARFRFDPSKGVDPQDIAAIDRDLPNKKSALQREILNKKAALERELLSKKATVEREILNGPAELKRLAHEILTARSTLSQKLAEALRTVMQAEADIKAVGR